MTLDRKAGRDSLTDHTRGAVPKWLRGRSAKPLFGSSILPRTSNLSSALKVLFSVVALAALIGSCATPATKHTERVGTPPPPAFGEARDFSLFDTPDHVVSEPSAVIITGHIPPGESREYIHLLAVPPGERTLVVDSVVLRDPRSGELFDSRTDPSLLAEPSRINEVNNRFDMKELGRMRRVDVARVRARLRERLTSFQPQLEIATYRIRIEATNPPPPSPDKGLDSGFSDPNSPYRELITKSVANPDAIDLYETPLGESPEQAAAHDTTGWRPLPGSSMGMPWLKIPVTTDGLYTIDETWVREAGIDPSTIKPWELRLFSNGKGVPLEPVLPGELTFADGQRLMFFGRGNRSDETIERPYYIGRTLTKDMPPRFRASGVPAIEGEPSDQLNRRLVMEEEKRLETRLGNFLSIRGMTWVWHQLDTTEPFKHEFDLPGLVRGDRDTTMRLVLYYAALSIPTDIPSQVSVNGQSFDLGPLPSINQFLEVPTVNFTVPQGVMKEKGNRIEFTIGNSPSMKSGLPPLFVDRLEIQYPSYFAPAKGRLELYGEDVFTDGRRAGPQKFRTKDFRLYRLNAIDLTNPEMPGRLAVDVKGSEQLAYVGDLTAKMRIMLIDDEEIERAPAPVSFNIREIDASKISADTLIVYYKDFKDAADRLAEDLRSAGQEVVIEDVENLYEWYNDGALSWGAIQHYIRDVVTSSTGRRPSQVVLIGDSTSDGRGISRNAVKNQVPTHSFTDARRRQSDQFATDQVYAWLSGEDEFADILVGRLSVNTREAAAAVVDKQIKYRQLKDQPWASRMLTLVDFGVFEDKAREMVDRGVNPATPHRILAAAEHPWEDNYFLPTEAIRDEDRKVAPVVTAELQRAFNDGTGVISFFGHGAPNLWSNQRIWFGGDSDNSDNLLLSNSERLAFVTSFTCNNGAIDYPMPRWNVCIAEDMMRVPGGAIGVFMPSGPGFPDQHVHFADGLMRAISQLGVRRLGVASELGRLAYQVRMGSDDHSRMYIYLGVPTMRLPATTEKLKLGLRDSEDRIVAAATDAYGDMTLRVEADEAMTSAVLTVATTAGNVLVTEQIPVEGRRGKVTFALPMGTPRIQGDLVVQAAATLASGKLALGGRRVITPKNGLFIEDIAGLTDWSDSLERTLYVTLRNDNHSAHEGRLTGFLTDDQGVTGKFFISQYRLGARSRGTFPITVRADRAGVYSLEIVTSSTKPELVPATSTPAFAIRRPIFIGKVNKGLVWMKHDTVLRPGLGSDGNVSWLFPLINASQTRLDDVYATIESEVPTGKAVGQPVLEPLGSVAPGEPKWIGGALKLPRELSSPYLLRLTIDERATSTTTVAQQEYTQAEFPDLEIVPRSIRITPDLLTQGSSVLVTLKVRNTGGQMGGPFRVALVSDKDGGPDSPLPSMTGDNDRELPALRPGAETEVRLRWDPYTELGRVRIWIVADTRNAHVERNKRNNTLPLFLDFRSKWKLRAGPIGFRPIEGGKVVLGALVQNDGETDARRISVLFYRSEEHTKENFLGEVLIPRVAAKSNQTIEFTWDISAEDPERLKGVKPSYTIQLKGSLQRVSSTTE